MFKIAALAILEARRSGRGLMRNAHRATFKYKPRKGFIYVRSRAISSRCNDNFDEFPAEEIAAAFETFIGKPVFVNHHNENHRRARGVIVAAVLHEDTNEDGSPDTWVEVLMEVDAIRFPLLAQKILTCTCGHMHGAGACDECQCQVFDGQISRTSMGCDVAYSKCSFCGNEASSPIDYCSHIKRQKGRRIRRSAGSGGMEDVLVSEICYGLRFFENSLLVEDPADPTAYFLGVESGDDLLAEGRHTAAIDKAASIAAEARVGQPGYLDEAAFTVLQARVKAKVMQAPTPTHEDIERNLEAMRTDGRAGGDFRGNSYDRRRRTQRLLEEFGNGTTAGCSYCGLILDASNLTEDKIITGKLGGRYINANLIPACQPCNAKRSDSPFALAMLSTLADHLDPALAPVLAFSGIVWQTNSTGTYHRSVACPHINGEMVAPVSMDDVREDGMVAGSGSRACTTCFPSAPPIRSRADYVRKTRTPEWDAEDETLHPRNKGKFTDGAPQGAAPAQDAPAAGAPESQEDVAEEWTPHPETTGEGTKEDPVRTGSVEDAAKALSLGLHVELKQAQQVSTLLDKLAEQIAAAKAQGSTLSIDLCNVTVKGTNLFCVESKGIPRVQMPQLKVQASTVPPDSRAAKEVTPNEWGEYDIQPLFLQALKDMGYEAEETDELASNLKATQNQLNAGKVAGITQNILGGNDRKNAPPIFVSDDDYIVDGHHRWAAYVSADWQDGAADSMTMPVWRINVDIITLLKLSNQFAEEYGIKGQGVTASKAPCIGCGDGPTIEEINAMARAKTAGLERFRVEAAASMPAPAKRYECTNRFGDRMAMNHDKGDGTPPRKKCRYCGGGWVIHEGLYGTFPWDRDNRYANDTATGWYRKEDDAQKAADATDTDVVRWKDTRSLTASTAASRPPRTPEGDELRREAEELREMARNCRDKDEPDVARAWFADAREKDSQARQADERAAAAQSAPPAPQWEVGDKAMAPSGRGPGDLTEVTIVEPPSPEQHGRVWFRKPDGSISATMPQSLTKTTSKTAATWITKGEMIAWKGADGWRMGIITRASQGKPVSMVEFGTTKSIKVEDVEEFTYALRPWFSDASKAEMIAAYRGPYPSKEAVRLWALPYTVMQRNDWTNEERDRYLEPGVRKIVERGREKYPPHGFPTRENGGITGAVTAGVLEWTSDHEIDQSLWWQDGPDGEDHIQIVLDLKGGAWWYEITAYDRDLASTQLGDGGPFPTVDEAERRARQEARRHQTTMVTSVVRTAPPALPIALTASMEKSYGSGMEVVYGPIPPDTTPDPRP